MYYKRESSYSRQGGESWKAELDLSWNISHEFHQMYAVLPCRNPVKAHLFAVFHLAHPIYKPVKAHVKKIFLSFFVYNMIML